MEPASKQLGELAENINYFHDHSGLSWKQISRLFGVPLRTVRLWAASLSKQTHESRVVQSRKLVERLNEIKESTPEKTLAKILNSSKGKSPYGTWMDEIRPKTQKIQFNSYDIFKDDMNRYKEEA